MKPLLEIAVFGLEGALIACEAGADRIELCVNYAQGGLTPSPDLVTAVVSRVTCPVFVMIRPKHGDFVYSAAELLRMKEDIVRAKQCGASGFVFGILQESSGIDEVACRELIQLAAPLPCTFHRAFDDLQDKSTGLEQLIRCGFQRVLTSGGGGSAIEHVGILKSLVAQAAGRIVVMPGGGIRPANLGQLAATGATEYHSAAVTGHSELPDEQAITVLLSILTGRNSFARFRISI